MRFLKIASLFVGVYLLSWTIGYAILMRFDFHYYFSYLAAAWKGPGETPAFIQWIALGLTACFAVGFVLWKKLKHG